MFLRSSIQDFLEVQYQKLFFFVISFGRNDLPWLSWITLVTMIWFGNEFLELAYDEQKITRDIYRVFKLLNTGLISGVMAKQWIF